MYGYVLNVLWCMANLFENITVINKTIVSVTKTKSWYLSHYFKVIFYVSGTSFILLFPFLTEEAGMNF